MEGLFSYQYVHGDDEGRVNAAISSIQAGKTGLKVCSLSQTFDSHLLWAHYASGFSGMAIEVEVPDDHPAVHAVRYGAGFAHITDIHERDPSQLAESILTWKNEAWEYEQEVRVLQRDTHFDLTAGVTRIIAGHRMNPELQRALKLICDSEGIDLCRVGIGDEGIDADPWD